MVDVDALGFLKQGFGGMGLGIADGENVAVGVFQGVLKSSGEAVRWLAVGEHGSANLGGILAGLVGIVGEEGA